MAGDVFYWFVILSHDHVNYYLVSVYGSVYCGEPM